ncbi:hypothetical protein BU26DRAFT_515325 [Trematosphaeria pertusa]|uniref:Uncharacterized protein n=1 Tax=Trematosphaeria pertusa TaxID=390896 RepID=A0A6A6IQS4_9PLEO|nr:uncharacterized protein BU26DRAFT_515325 [Trematosphaeria pertusa]KAF2252905.1 hypothetical protein BU26DRAFT_515325 [Trematosphaeria pertusa]
MNLPQIKGSINTNTVESNNAIVQNQFNVCLFNLRVEPPSEYLDVGLFLSRRRKDDADDGQSHLTAAQLGILFGGLVPKVPNLIRAYGLRCSEIANSPTFNPKGTSQHGFFANEIGADGTAVWAAATSGDSAIAVHLLGCMLSRMWDPPEAISIWMQLIAERKQILASSGNPLEYAAAKSISLTREQIASWHTSIQAWRRTADEANARRQNQLLLIINNLGIPVNTKLCLIDSVVDAWRTSMVTVDRLVSGQPQSVQTGAPLLGLAAWHLYPNMIIFGHGRSYRATEVLQDDPHIERGGVLTLGIQDIRRSGDGIYWSLPLAYLRYYGQPVQTEARLSSRTSRASFNELVYIALGSLMRRWLADANDIDYAAKLLVKLSEYIDISGRLRRDGAWLSLIACAASGFLTSEPEAKAERLQLIKCGRRRFPLFVDDPATDTIFGLSSPKTLLRLLPGNAAKVALLRHVARDFSDHRTLMVIQCKCGNPRSLWELASVEQFGSKSKRALEDPPEDGCNAPRRYIRWLNRMHRDLDQNDVQPDSDSLRLEAPIPWFYAPNGYHWQTPPQAFYATLLEEECGNSDWRCAKGVTIRSILAFGDPDIAALYCISIHYWTSFSPNIAPRLVGGPTYRLLPNIFVIRHVLRALEEELPSREFLFEYLDEGRFSGKILTSLKALQTASVLYGELHNATVELKAAEQPLHEHQWIPQDNSGHRHYPFAGFKLNREQMFACISKFESGTFNFPPSAMNGVLAISSGNSIYVASCLLQDPCHRRPSKTVERVVGNLGKTGMALLVCPVVPQVRSLSDDVRLVNHHPFDGSEEDSFRDTGLHLSYTEWQLPIDVGARGKRDVEAYYIEAAIGVYDRGKWVADLNILDVFRHRLSQIIPVCTQHHERPAPIEETSKFVTIDSWEELLDSPTEIGVVRARGNWQARLAAAALSIQQGHETRVVPEKTCWSCCLALEKISPDSKKEEETHGYDGDMFGSVPFDSDGNGSDSDTDEIVDMAARKRSCKGHVRESSDADRVRNSQSLNRNIVYIL